jgi:TonB family protein
MRILTLALALVMIAAPAAAQQRGEEARSATTKLGSDTTGVYQLREVTDLPRPTNTPAFQVALARSYPPALRNAGTSGVVTARFVVEPDGKVSHVTIVRSSNAAFDGPTLEAVRMLRFRPAKVNGRPVRVWVMQPIQWSVTADTAPSGAGRP